jgi:hypothetical protein
MKGGPGYVKKSLTYGWFSHVSWVSLTGIGPLLLTVGNGQGFYIQIHQKKRWRETLTMNTETDHHLIANYLLAINWSTRWCTGRTTIDKNFGGLDIRCFVRGKEQHSISNFISLTKSPERDTAYDAFL